MRAVLTNTGTLGDVQPFIALADELMRSGHDSVLALSPHLEPLARRYGIAFEPVGPDLERSQGRAVDQALELVAGDPEAADSADRLREILAPWASALPSIFEDLRAVCRGADVLVAGPLQPAASMIHELTGLPYVSIQLYHFGGGGGDAMARATESLVNPFRRRLGLAELADPITMGANSQLLALYAISPAVLPRPVHWPGHHHMVGYFFLEDRGWEPHPELTGFLDAGEPPVFVTFGSMGAPEDHRRRTEAAVDAINRTGRRALLQLGGESAARRELPAGAMTVDYVPYDWLLPRVACAVHHGGAGTAAWVFRSGVPSVFVTHFGDQTLWASLAQSLGVSGPPLPFAELTGERLAGCIERTLASDRCVRAAREVGRRVRSERGVARARKLIEELLESLGLAGREEPRRSTPDPGSGRTTRPRSARRTEYLRRRQRVRGRRRRGGDR